MELLTTHTLSAWDPLGTSFYFLCCKQVDTGDLEILQSHSAKNTSMAPAQFSPVSNQSEKTERRICPYHLAPRWHLCFLLGASPAWSAAQGAGELQQREHQTLVETTGHFEQLSSKGANTSESAGERAEPREESSARGTKASISSLLSSTPAGFRCEAEGESNKQLKPLELGDTAVFKAGGLSLTKGV